MLRPLAILVLLVVALASACGGGKARIQSAELPKLVLQTADLPSYSQFDEGKQTSLDAQPGPRKDPARFGRKAGWKARYRVMSPGGSPAVIESRADVFGNTGGAKDDLDAYAKQLAEPPPGSGATVVKLSGAPALGDGDPVAVELRQGPSVIYTVAWRLSNATASISAGGRTAKLRPADVYRIAKLQAARIRRAASH